MVNCLFRGETVRNRRNFSAFCSDFLLYSPVVSDLVGNHEDRFSCDAASYLLTSYSIILLLARSALFPANAITILGLACLCSSFTQVFARPNVS